MKKNIPMRIAYYLLIAVILSTYALTSTFAKYATTLTSNTSSTTVAEWSFNVEDVDITTNTVSINLFDTVTNVDGTAEKNVRLTDGKMIAPGTKGSFSIKLRNTSEVTAMYGIEFTMTKTEAAENLPILFSRDGKTWSSDLPNVAADSKTYLAMGSGTYTENFYWKWDYTGANDTVDTALGRAVVKGKDVSVILTATVTAYQVD